VARSLGVHVEGPFLSTLRSGAHPRRHLRPPSLDEVGTWGPGVAMVTLAPELPGALAVVERLSSVGVTVCAGHTEVDPWGMAAAVAAGVTGVTHLFNAMGPMSARRPGAAGATLADPALLAGVIVDGIHVDPVMVRLAWRLLGPSRFVLVSDAMAALGLPPGAFAIGETEVTVDDAGVARTADGVLAGSVLRFDAGVRNLIAFAGCSLAEASLSASATPARLAQRSDVGRLAPGCPADIVVLDEERRVAVTIVGGRVAFDRDGRST
jgi:N-acetylglucosamine-6-phosphate deacetylase